MTAIMRSKNGTRWFLLDLFFGYVSFLVALYLTPHHEMLYDAPFGLIAVGFALCVALSSVFVGVPVVGRDHEAALYEIIIMLLIAVCCAAMCFALISSMVFFTIFGRYILAFSMLNVLFLMIFSRWIIFVLHQRTPLYIYLVGAMPEQVQELTELFSDTKAFKVMLTSAGEGFPGADTLSLSNDRWPSQLESRSVGTVILCGEAFLTDDQSRSLLELPLHGLAVFSYASFLETFFKRVPVRYMSSKEVAAIHVCSKDDPIFLTKRIVDILVALFGLLVSLPLWILIALAIKWDSSGSVFFIQERDGIGDTTFQLLKFRTMSGEASPQTDDDHRITRIGRVLRKTRLDELPQFLNVLKGDMALVGPRPEYSGYTQEFQEKIPYYAYRRLIRPGLTGWAQIRYRYSTTWQEVEQKFQYDLYYIRHVSFQLDMWILIKTLPLLMKGSR